MAQESNPNPSDTIEQIAKLREQVEMLMRERVTPVLADAASRAESALGTVREQTAAMSERVREQPIPAVLIAAAVGFLLGRVMR
ncbi:MAG TPA: hypothetical protein VFA03_12175 [Acetobacteraceae bacterium]|nr:hypothetical protein [Acetobacteraceae bacterium]